MSAITEKDQALKSNRITGSSITARLMGCNHGQFTVITECLSRSSEHCVWSHIWLPDRLLEPVAFFALDFQNVWSLLSFVSSHSRLLSHLSVDSFALLARPLAFPSLPPGPIHHPFHPLLEVGFFSVLHWCDSLIDFLLHGSRAHLSLLYLFVQS